MRKICLLFLSLLCLISTKAQKLTVESFSAKTNDLSASTHERKDLNGKSCALVKVQLATAGAEFLPNVIGDIDYKVSEYWVYLPTTNQHLEVKVPNFTTKDIVFADYGITLEPKATYILTLSLPETGSVPQMATSQFLVFNLKPEDAILTVNGEEWTNTGGIIRKLVPFGNYTYTITADNYRTHTGSVKVNDPKNKVVVNVDLEHAFGSVNIPSSASMDGATVYLDDKNVGTTPLILQNVIAGTHTLVIKKEGYLSWIENINVQDQQTFCIANKKLAKAPTHTISFTANGVSFEMVKVKAGKFKMGATEEMETYLEIDKPVHGVILTEDYYIGKHEVTQALWQAVMGNNPSKFKGDDLPVEKVNWKECKEFIRKLNRITRMHFRLPTEAEWEYAARGGKKSRGYRYSGSNNLSDVAWFDGNSGSRTHPVGTLQPNELGIYDMAGNVAEWCEDWYNRYCVLYWKAIPAGSFTDKFYREEKDGTWYYAEYQTNPKGTTTGPGKMVKSDDPTQGVGRVVRGGTWYNDDKRLFQSSCRDCFEPDIRSANLGLRLCLTE